MRQQIGGERQRAFADLEIGDTAGLETGATGANVIGVNQGESKRIKPIVNNFFDTDVWRKRLGPNGLNLRGGVKSRLSGQGRSRWVKVLRSVRGEGGVGKEIPSFTGGADRIGGLLSIGAGRNLVEVVVSFWVWTQGRPSDAQPWALRRNAVGILGWRNVRVGGWRSGVGEVFAWACGRRCESGAEAHAVQVLREVERDSLGPARESEKGKGFCGNIEL